jgi:hypothetical protein
MELHKPLQLAPYAGADMHSELTDNTAAAAAAAAAAAQMNTH